MLFQQEEILQDHYVVTGDKWKWPPLKHSCLITRLKKLWEASQTSGRAVSWVRFKQICFTDLLNKVYGFIPLQSPVNLPMKRTLPLTTKTTNVGRTSFVNKNRHSYIAHNLTTTHTNGKIHFTSPCGNWTSQSDIRHSKHVFCTSESKMQRPF